MASGAFLAVSDGLKGLPKGFSEFQGRSMSVPGVSENFVAVPKFFRGVSESFKRFQDRFKEFHGVSDP